MEQTLPPHKSPPPTPQVTGAGPASCRSSAQCVFCLTLQFQHPQLEAGKVSKRLGHSQSAEAGPGAGQARSQECPHPSSQTEPRTPRAEKVRGLVPSLSGNFPAWTRRVRGLMSQVGLAQLRFSEDTTALQTTTAKRQKQTISQARHLWEQPLASGPAQSHHKEEGQSRWLPSPPPTPVQQDAFPGCSRKQTVA